MYETKEEVRDAFETALDDCGPAIEIVGLQYAPSRVLKAVDPTAWRMAFLEFVDDEEREAGFTYDDLEGYDYDPRD